MLGSFSEEEASGIHYRILCVVVCLFGQTGRESI